MNRLPFAVLFALAPLLMSTATADESPRYESSIAKILQEKCVRCHNGNVMKAELDLSTPQGLFKGGESGASIEPGKLDDSLLWEMVHSKAMPPEDEGELSEHEIETIRLWIEAGTPFDSPEINVKELLAAGEVDNHAIEPLMLLRCAVCHGLRTQEGGLDLRTKASMLKGGKSGPAIVLGKPEESLLLKKIHAGEMPPKKLLIRSGVRPITPDEIAKLTRWIELGAPEVTVDPDVASTEPDPLVTDEDRQHWAFQPPRDVAVPAITGDRVQNPIDAFVLRKLAEHNLTLSPEADRLSLIRRAYFDLTGLPPEPDDVAAYLEDTTPGWYEHMIDSLLTSPRYGERWGRFWLDNAGYADSEGKRSADPIRPYAYKYRDYVIRALNADKPYDRFLLEQLAGDELADYKTAPEITEEIADNLVATGFLRQAPDGTGSDVVNTVPERLEVIADEIDIFSSTVLGLTMKCARCHTHKYDPIPQRDYYRLAAVFKGAFDEHDWLKPAFVPGQTKVVRPGRVLPYATAAELKAIEEQNARIAAEIKAEEQKIADLAASIRKEHAEKELAKLPEELRDDLRRLLATPADDRDEVQVYLAKKFEQQLTLDDNAVKKHPGYSRAATEINRVIKSLEGEKADGPQTRALWDRGEPSPTYIYKRGDYRQPGRLVGPGVPSMLTNGSTPFEATPPFEGATGRRLALAKWLVEDDHPLTARVMVNRIWKHHFGEGIVRSLDNFGKLGVLPTHPDLLDWLAREFVRRDWSIKEMHRLLMTSATYRQSSAVTDQLLALDPENKLLSRMPLRRLDAEELRDTMIAVADRLSEARFGRPDQVNARKDGLVTSRGSSGAWRRSIYVRQRRKEIATVLATFDLPQMDPNCKARVNSTVAQQALHLLNDTRVRELSEHFADRIHATAADSAARINQIYLVALSRPPTAEEHELGSQTLSELTNRWRAQLADGEADDAEQRALATYCHTLMNSAAFLYVD